MHNKRMLMNSRDVVSRTGGISRSSVVAARGKQAGKYRRLACCIAVAGACSPVAFAGGGPLGIDHRLPFDESGIWKRSNELAVRSLSAAAVVGGALWEGNDTRLGRTFWKATDAMLLADISAEVGKRVFRRQRPINGN